MFCCGSRFGLAEIKMRLNVKKDGDGRGFADDEATEFFFLDDALCPKFVVSVHFLRGFRGWDCGPLNRIVKNCMQHFIFS